MKIPYVFKKCTKCGEWLVASKVNFHKNKNGKYGLGSQCKECKNADRKRNYQLNIEREKARHKKYHKEHKEERRKYYKKQYNENKEKRKGYVKKYNDAHKEQKREYDKKYHKEHKEEIVEKRKIYYKTPQGQVAIFNGNIRRRQKEGQQGNGITKDQWLEMMKFFEWKCAYSGKYIGGNDNNRTIDHIIPLAKNGEHEVWNLVPMYKPYNSSKHDSDMKEWYIQQDFYNEDRLNKIYKWQEYAYNKWSK